jgi:hypothetical protein
MFPHAVAAASIGSVAYLGLLHHWFFNPRPSIQIKHNETGQEATVKFTTLTAVPCVTEKTVHHGLPCLQEKYTLLPVTGHAVVGEAMFRVLGVTSLGNFEKACDACSVHTEVTYKNEFGVLVRENIPWTHSVSVVRD